MVRDEPSFRVALWRSGQARRLQAGEYRFDRPMSAREVIDKIARGEVFTRPITFPEGLDDPADVADSTSVTGLGPAADFVAAAQNAGLDRGRRSGRAGSRRLPVSEYLLAAAQGDGGTTSSSAWSPPFATR